MCAGPIRWPSAGPRNTLLALLAENVQSRYLKPCRGEQVDHLARVHPTADDLPDRGVHVAPTEAPAVFRLIGKPLLEHRHQPLVGPTPNRCVGPTHAINVPISRMPGPFTRDPMTLAFQPGQYPCVATPP